MKNKPATTILIAVAFATMIFLTPPAIQAAGSNDNDKAQAALDELKALAAEKAPAEISKPAEVALWSLTVKRPKITEMAKALYKAYPKAPQRWEAVLIMFQNEPIYILPDSHKVDSVSNENWRSQAAQLAAKLKAAPDVPDQIQRDFHAVLLRSAINDLSNLQRTNYKGKMPQGITDDYRSKSSPLTSGLKNFLARWPDYDAKKLFEEFIDLPAFKKSDDVRKAVLKEFQDTPNTSVSDYIKVLFSQQDKLANIGNLTFMTMDGRKVNLKEMLGKVVLFYKWTIPTDKDKKGRKPLIPKLYNTYHDQGLEIIGISNDDADAKDQVYAFIKEHSIPGLINYEGKVGSQNPILKALGLDGTEKDAPQGLLIDKQGKASFVRSPATAEPAIKRLLNQ